MKRKRYTEDLEFRISDDDDDGDDSTGPKSPSATSEQQVIILRTYRFQMYDYTN